MWLISQKENQKQMHLKKTKTKTLCSKDKKKMTKEQKKISGKAIPPYRAFGKD